MIPMNYCINCRYFKPGTADHGECHFNPPVFVPNFLPKFSETWWETYGFLTRFPVVDPDEWQCGKFSPAAPDIA